jgi:hypothetical protein
MTSHPSDQTPDAPRRDIVLLGDRLRSLETLNTRTAPSPQQEPRAVPPAEEREPVATVVIGSDLGDATTRTMAEERLRDSVMPQVDSVDDFQRLRNIIIVTAGAATVNRDDLLRTGDDVAREIEAELQRSKGVTLSVTVVILDDDFDPDLLARRITERTDSSFSLGPFAVLGKTLRRQSLRDAETTDYL